MNKVPKTQLCLEGFRLQSSNPDDKISLWTSAQVAVEFTHVYVRTGSFIGARVGKYFATLTSR